MSFLKKKVKMCCPSSFNNWLPDPKLDPQSKKYSKDCNFKSGVLLKFVRRPWGARTQARLHEQIQLHFTHTRSPKESDIAVILRSMIHESVA